MEKSRSALDLFDTSLADQVRTIKDYARLRKFACDCASLALDYCGVSDPRSFNAVAVARMYASGGVSDDELDEAYARAEEAAEDADEAAFIMRDAFEKGKASERKYSQMFAAARAAFSARDCCARSAMAAANDAGYEAAMALGTIVENGRELSGLGSIDLAIADTDSAITTIFEGLLER